MTKQELKELLVLHNIGKEGQGINERAAEGIKELIRLRTGGKTVCDNCGQPAEEFRLLCQGCFE